MKRPMQWKEDLPKRNVIYQHTHEGLGFDALVEKYQGLYEGKRGEYLGHDHECAALPQFLTDVGYTGRWQPGPRVIDLAFVVPGTVVANFKIVNGKPKFPNESGWHVGLFHQYWHGARMVNGLPCAFSMFDQFHGKPASVRGVAILTPEWKKAHPRYATPSNDAAEYYLVVVP
jgi:hypothetical protein